MKEEDREFKEYADLRNSIYKVIGKTNAKVVAEALGACLADMAGDEALIIVHNCLENIEELKKEDERRRRT